MKIRKTILSATLLGVVLISCTSLPSNADNKSEKIATISSLRAGNNLTLIELEGRSEALLTWGGEADYDPAWIPGQQKIVFSRDAFPNGVFEPQLLVIDVETGLVSELPVNQGITREPAISSDGQWIAFSGTNDILDQEIYVLSLATDKLINLTETPGKDQHPTWSSDGSMIAFSTDRLGKWDIFYMLSNGLDSEQIFLSENNETEPSWSPNGKMIAFVSDISGNRDIYVINLDTSELVQITTSLADEYSPDWSPEGNRLAYVEDILPQPSVFIYDFSTGKTTTLTNPGILHLSPVWEK